MNNALLEIYQTSINGMRKYHNAKLADLSVDGKKFRPPIKIQINKTNLPNIQQGLVSAYKTMKHKTDTNEASFRHLSSTGCLGKFFSVFNDGIQKYTREFNGVFIRTVDSSNFTIKNLPWALNEIPGGSMDSIKLVTTLLKTIHEVIMFRYF